MKDKSFSQNTRDIVNITIAAVAGIGMGVAAHFTENKSNEMILGCGAYGMGAAALLIGIKKFGFKNCKPE